MVAVQRPTPLATLDWQWHSHRLRYTVVGEGTQSLLLLHGFGASLGHWQKNIPVLAAAGYRVYALDLLGFGASDKPPLDYTVELWVDLIQDFWAEKIQQPMVLVGNSIGGLLSLMLLARGPQITRGAVLINCAGGLNHRPDELNWPLRLIMGTFAKAVSSPLTGPFLFNLIRQKSRIQNTLYQVYCDRTAVTDELVEMLYRPSCEPGAQQVFASVLTAPPGPSPSELLPHIQQPLLVLWGDADPWTPIKGAEIYTTHPDVTFHPILNAGHCPHDEVPDVVNDHVLTWLKDQAF
ncbi:MAG: alpha/beta fold hydrolase [Spirulina sp. SIO3F2]|nr:alpha/beta fold hydrolase [Spirulina sp. SIO3F2]